MSLLEHYCLGDNQVGGIPYNNICGNGIQVTHVRSTKIQQWEGFMGFSGEKYHNFLYDFVRLNDSSFHSKCSSLAWRQHVANFSTLRPGQSTTNPNSMSFSSGTRHWMKCFRCSNSLNP